jgi:2-dehydropantoate 2-reductase
LHPKIVTAGEISGPYDAVLLTVKAYSLDAALDDLAPAVGPDTFILPVLNGMKHVDTIKARFGDKVLLGCVCKVATIVDEQGRIVQLSKLQDLAYGEMNGACSPRTDELDKTMQGAGFNARLSPSIAREMWEKWVLLASLGGITCLMRGNIGEVEAAPGGADFALSFLDEVVSVVNAVGVKPDDRFITETSTLFTTKGSPQTSSMYRDLQKGATVEADQILGDLLTRARKANIDTPLLAAAYAHLSVYQNKLLAR